ncbi:hypothetical protein B9K03_02100 [Rothia sp. Olga]|nr:hypothetical protein B9K03_02100 [Rothia sp. Olga]
MLLHTLLILKILRGAYSNLLTWVVDMLRFKILQENRNKVVRQQKLGLDQITLLLRFLLKNKRRRIKHGRNISKRTVLSRCRVL